MSEELEKAAEEHCKIDPYDVPRAFKAGAEWATPKWISVRERLPREGEHVLTHGNWGTETGSLVNQFWWSIYGGDSLPAHKEITHWMPLPEDPK